MKKEAAGAMLKCRIFAMELATGEEKYLELYCRSFYEVYGKLRNQGLRLISYMVM